MIYYSRLPGRAANASQLGAGQLWHAIEIDDEHWPIYWYGPALCGAKPGKRTPGWSGDLGDHATCPKCLKRLAALTNGK